ncbi:hypothetical protein N866_07020 [Actinotalea ferrariae CF5-4]|uniref:Uncharacterized protein n=1 Tax=Actinotalea ferrariae CF5-4 TaxID=948458 RepID=A0A021VU25_9CELL|nr:hypothetical protein [Actinotalea ferrariae]EYR64656.1 hypothetical protein N866_07020 [Actinotalea ferrariae CF5-4]
MSSHPHAQMRLTADGVEPAIYACAVCQPELLWRKDQHLCVLCGKPSCDGRHRVPTLQVVQMVGPETKPAAEPSWWAEEREAAHQRAGGLRWLLVVVLALVVLTFASLIAATIAAAPASALPAAHTPRGAGAVVGELVAWIALAGGFVLAGVAMARRDRERRR